MSDSLCVSTPSYWPANLQEWGQKVAKMVLWVDPFPEVPAGYFGNTDLDRYYLQQAIKAARRYWGS